MSEKLLTTSEISGRIWKLWSDYYQNENSKPYADIVIESDLLINTFAEQAAKLALEIAAKKAKLRTISCGDPNTCGCQGTCEHPMYYINEKSILSLLPEIMEQLKEKK